MGQGLRDGDEAQWNKLLTDLDAAIAKEAQIEPSRGHQSKLGRVHIIGDICGEFPGPRIIVRANSRKGYSSGSQIS